MILSVMILAAAGAAEPSQGAPLFDFRDPTLYDGERIKPILPEGYFKYCVRAIHPPRVEWTAVGGVAQYKLILTQDRKVLGEGTAAGSPHFMREGWDKVKPGRVAHVTIKGFDKDGKLIAMSRMFRIFVAPAYDPAEVKPARYSYREAALKAFAALENTKVVHKGAGPSSPTMSVVDTAVFVKSEPMDFTFPTIHDPGYAAMLESLMGIADEELRGRIERFARKVGDHILMCRFNEPDWVYRGLVRGCADVNGRSKTFGNPDDRTARRVEVSKCGYIGEALLRIHAITREQKYLDAAVEMAETLIRTQAADGSWPGRADARDGKPIIEYGACVGSVAAFLDRLNGVKADKRWTEARDRAEHWMAEHPMKTYAWVTNFDDIPSGASNADPFSGALSNFDLYPYMRYLCDARRQPKEELAARVREQMEWADNQFVFYGPDPLLPYDPWYPVCAEQGQPEIFDKENGCWVPMDGHTSNLGQTMLALHRLTGEKRWLEIARAAGNALTHYQLNDGRTMTWMCDQTFGFIPYHGADFRNYSFWPAGWAFAATLWAELAKLEE